MPWWWIPARERWIAAASIQAGEPLFRSIKKGGDIRGRLQEGGVSLALKACVSRYLQCWLHAPEAAVAAAAKYSGHGGRVGMYTAAFEAGIVSETLPPQPGRNRSTWRRSMRARRTS